MSYNDPVEQRLARLNEFTLGLLKEALEADYGADLTPVLRTALGTYTIKRSDILDRSDTDSTYTVSEVNYAVSEYESPTIAGFESDAHSIYSAASSIPSTIVEIRPFFSHITGPITLRSFPHPDVFAQVTGSPQNTYMQDPAAAFTYLPQILDRGRVLWSTHARSIVQLSPTIAVKAGPAEAVDTTEHALLATLASRAPGVPAPRPMGIVQIGGVVFMFMSCVQGTPLDKCWGELTKAQKVSVRRQLNQALHQLRSVPYTPGTPLGALAAPFACKDTRPAAALSPYGPAYVHTSARAIYTETGFNDFLLATPRARVAPAYARGTRATLVGIVDWERGGWYPEYWELVKALRTRTPEDESDWWEWMPEVIAGYRAEVAIDRVVEATIAPPGQPGVGQGQGSQGAGKGRSVSTSSQRSPGCMSPGESRHHGRSSREGGKGGWISAIAAKVLVHDASMAAIVLSGDVIHVVDSQVRRRRHFLFLYLFSSPLFTSTHSYAMAKIIVHAQFPISPSPDARTDPANWVWQPCLAFPADKLADLHLSLRPFKWIRYATGVVVGARGDLSHQQDSLAIINYNDALPDASIDLYYHLADQEKSSFFPLDPELAIITSSTLSSLSDSSDHFFNEVAQRDEDRCVVTGLDVRICDAVHLLDQSKGNAYIDAFTRGRSRGPDKKNSIVSDIDSVRNGILVDATLHRVLGCEFTILVTPNFAMDSGDIEEGAQGQRFTAHFFEPSLARLYRDFNGQAIRCPRDMSQWPPAVLFDSIYARTVVHYFGILPKSVLEPWKDIFYSTISAHTGSQDGDARDFVADNEVRKQEVEQDQCSAPQGRRQDSVDLLLMSYAYVPADVMEKYVTERQETLARKERESLEVMVSSWKDGLAIGP
ncbi:hypothetical protein EVG20_g3957 [Dentipellis fragilis]|uniref:HNH nuclease domain-containing protein n=1 Tax=Dentipellis fragilis TaxID=205917 RepID=A0A4Y9YYQ7_9AGAM|nr:hypothetical protein EVG20_g3957 [Dentipellis fragilis]